MDFDKKHQALRQIQWSIKAHVQSKKSELFSEFYDQSTAMKNLSLNRYQDILPYDGNYVKLGSQSDNNYINASFIRYPFNFPPDSSSLTQVDIDQCDFIASQGPMQHTIPHFWFMIIRYKISCIFMLTALVDGQRVKCDKYWPSAGSDFQVDLQQFQSNEKSVSISTQTERDINGVQHRIFKLMIQYKDGSVQEYIVNHFQYLGWPDHHVPSSPLEIINLVDLIQSFKSNNSPTVIHCSAGCGRTGTLIAVYYYLKLYGQNMNDDNDDLMFDIAQKLRMQRVSMVESTAQLKYCYDVIKYLKPKS